MEYLKNNAVLECDKGLVPSVLNITSNPKIKNRDGLFATNKDNISGENITSFVTCSIAYPYTCQLNGSLSGQPLNWVNTVSKVTISGEKPLHDESKCICPLGGVISTINSGQI